ncbi:GSCOCG00010654001-RA-CDS [Cotesia congregata]|nr:GSCOCG00010654001-RA-CDS [Cotesia congregata]
MEGSKINLKIWKISLSSILFIVLILLCFLLFGYSRYDSYEVLKIFMAFLDLLVDLEEILKVAVQLNNLSYVLIFPLIFLPMIFKKNMIIVILVSRTTRKLIQMDCHVLTESYIDNNDISTIGHSSGYLFKNWFGKWYPDCTLTEAWADKACRGGIGLLTGNPTIKMETALRKSRLGPYISMTESGNIELTPS